MSNPIIPHDEPAPEMDGTPKRHIYRMSELFMLPRGIEMKEYGHSDGSITFIGQYYNKQNAQPANRPKRVYRVEVLPDMGDWRAAVLEDSSRLVTLRGDSKWNVAFAALGALRGILHKRCVATGGNRRRRRKAAALNPVNPVNPV